MKENAIWGPLFLLCAVAIGAKTSIPLDLLFLAASGLYLSARYQMRGFYYSLALLGIAAAIKHAFFASDHLWQLGIEGSLALASFITALSFEEDALHIESLNQQIETRKAALENLEEEFAKNQEMALAQQIALSEKHAALQKELDELQSDHSSILILNEVLRKTTARHVQESESLAATVRDHEQQTVLLKEELKEAHQDLERLSNTEALAIQNRELLADLNAARYAKEQTLLVNETLARLHVKESLKASDAEKEASDLESQLAAARKEVQKVSASLQEQLAASRNQIDTLTSQLERANQERQTLVEMQKRPPENPQLGEQLAHAQEKMVHLSQIEPLFKQLKKQFEEKNQVLHQTRTHLFMTDTELQKLKMEKQALELTPFPKEVEKELQELTSQITALEEENQQLQELISVLTDKTAVKKN